MPQPKPSTVVLILVLFACVAVYVLGAGLGAQDDTPSGEPGMTKEEREGLRNRLFGDPPSVAPGELTATSGCSLSGGVVRVVSGRSCEVDIAGSDARLRTLKVEPLGGGVVDLRLELKGRAPVTVPFEKVDEAGDYNVLWPGAKLTLECRTPASANQCPVRLR